MNEQHAGAEGTTQASKERGTGVAAKSHEVAERLENAVVDRAKQVRHSADTAREQAAERFRRVALHLRSVGDNLRSEDQMAAVLAERASRGVDGVAEYVASTDLRSAVRDAERLARQHPAAFFGGAFVLGLALGRLLKNSPPHAARDGSGESSESFPARPEQAREQSRRSPPPVPTPAAQQRYRENYDATFARDDGASVPDTSSMPSSPSTAGGSSSTKPGTGSRNGERSPESNGGRSSGQGKLP